MSRALRWKPAYSLGDAESDARNRHLLEILAEVADLMRRFEHCGDLDEVFAETSQAVITHLKDGRSPQEEVRRLITRRLPLGARSGAACRDCGICDLFANRLGAWAGEGMPAG